MMRLLELEAVLAASLVVVLGIAAAVSRHRDRPRKLRLEADQAKRHGRGVGDVPRDDYSGDGA